MDIFLTQEADLVQRLNNMCNDMEMTIENMSKGWEKNGDMPAKKERVATMNAEKAAESLKLFLEGLGFSHHGLAILPRYGSQREWFSSF